MQNDDVSQFVTGHFSDAINMVEVCSGAADERKCPHKVLFQKVLTMKKKCLYNILKSIESRVAGIIDQKILSGAKLYLLDQKSLIGAKWYLRK